MEIPQDPRLTDNGAIFDDEKMFETVFKAYFHRLTAFARKFITDKTITEDIIQDVFYKVWINRKEIREENFQAYLFTLVRNACLNHIRHQKIVEDYRALLEDTAKEEGLYYADFYSDPFHQTIFKEVQQEIDKAMQSLPEQTRKVFQLSRYEGLKNSEIAERLNITLRTVEKHNTKALQKIKTHLSSQYLLALLVLDFVKEMQP